MRRWNIIKKEKLRQNLYNETHRINEQGQIEKFCKYNKHWVIMDDEHFYKQHTNADGFHTYCKTCNKIKAKIWAKNNPEKVKISKKKDKLKPYRLKQQQYYDKRARESGYFKKYEQEHREQFRKYSKKRGHKNHKISKKEWKACKEYFGDCCAYCGMSNEEAKKKYNNYLHKEHVDHNGTNDLSNCIPACKSCNSLKAKKSFDEWYNPNNERYENERYSKILKWLNEDYKKYIKNKNK